MSEGNSSKFKVKQVTTFEQLRNKEIVELPTSDLCLTDEKGIYQFEYLEPEEVVKGVEVKPGVYTMIKTMAGIGLQDTTLNISQLLESVTNTQIIKTEVGAFFSKLAVYDKLKLLKKRGILLYSKPGFGKTSSINRTVLDLVNEDPGTVVMIWPTDAVESSVVGKFLSFAAQYTDKCTRLILIVEDIGGSEEGSSRPRGVDTSLLNLLDGVNVTFKLPTFIIATTNYPENLLSALADRPGRFDQMIELLPPSYEEKVKIMEFIANRQLEEDEKAAFKIAGSEALSIAHLKEIITRTLLHDKTIRQVVQEMVDHSAKFQAGFEKKGRMGMGF